MNKFAQAALLGLSLIVATPAVAAPTPAALMTQAQNLLATDPTKAAALLQEVAAVSGSLTSEQATALAALLQEVNAWAEKSCATTANTDACSSIYTSMLTIAGSPAVTAASPNLYATILTGAQEFTNNAPKDNSKVAELESFLQLALGTPTPSTNAQRPAQPTAD